jgi:hypothetical protein
VLHLADMPTCFMERKKKKEGKALLGCTVNNSMVIGGEEHVEHVAATISSCQPERSTRPQETDLRPFLGPTKCNHPGGMVPGRKHARDGVAGSDAVPFGRAALALDLPSGCMRTVAVAWTPSTERREPGGDWARQRPRLLRGKS